VLGHLPKIVSFTLRWGGFMGYLGVRLVRVYARAAIDEVNAPAMALVHAIEL
jgi:hypothetical protein